MGREAIRIHSTVCCMVKGPGSSVQAISSQPAECDADKQASKIRCLATWLAMVQFLPSYTTAKHGDDRNIMYDVSISVHVLPCHAPG